MCIGCGLENNFRSVFVRYVYDFALWKKNQPQDAAAGEEVCKEHKRNKYIARLKKVASRLPQNIIEDSMTDMRRGCERLWEAKGGHFQ